MLTYNSKGEIKDVAVKDVTPENFIVKNGEERLYHCKIEIKRYSADDGKLISRPRIQSFGKKFFENGGLQELKRQGYSVVVLYNPNEWIEKQKKLKEEKEEKKREEKKLKEREEMKKEIMKELEEKGLLKESFNGKPEEKEQKNTKKTK